MRLKSARFYFILALLGALAFNVACSRMTLTCSERDPVEAAGIEHFQKFVDQVNKYKAEHGKYPKAAKDLASDLFDGAGYPNEKITDSTVTLKPEQDYFDVKFYFDREKTCLTLIGNNRACEYTSETKKWTCY